MYYVVTCCDENEPRRRTTAFLFFIIRVIVFFVFLCYYNLRQFNLSPFIFSQSTPALMSLFKKSFRLSETRYVVGLCRRERRVFLSLRGAWTWKWWLRKFVFYTCLVFIIVYAELSVGFDTCRFDHCAAAIVFAFLCAFKDFDYYRIIHSAIELSRM